MSIDHFIITVFCLIDDELKNILKMKKLRSRGPAPSLADSEVITMEVAGEFLGKDEDKAIEVTGHIFSQRYLIGQLLSDRLPICI